MALESELFLLQALKNIDDRLARIEHWTEGHDRDHRERADNRSGEKVQYENRITRLESIARITVGVGAPSVIVYIVLETLRQLGYIR